MSPKMRCALKKLNLFTAFDLTNHEKANVFGGKSTVVLVNNDPDPDNPNPNTEGDPDSVGGGLG